MASLNIRFSTKAWHNIPDCIAKNLLDHVKAIKDIRDFVKAIEQNVRDYIQEYKLADGSTAYVSCVVCYFPIL